MQISRPEKFNAPLMSFTTVVVDFKCKFKKLSSNISNASSQNF